MATSALALGEKLAALTGALHSVDGHLFRSRTLSDGAVPLDAAISAAVEYASACKNILHRLQKRVTQLKTGAAVKTSESTPGLPTITSTNGLSYTWEEAHAAFIEKNVNSGTVKQPILTYDETVALCNAVRADGAALVTTVLPERIAQGRKGVISAALYEVLKQFPVCVVEFPEDGQRVWATI